METKSIELVLGLIPWARYAVSFLIALLVAEAVMVAGARVGELLGKSLDVLLNRKKRDSLRKPMKAAGRIAALTIAVGLTIVCLI